MEKKLVYFDSEEYLPFCYEHLVTTFTQLNIACVVFCMEQTAEIEVTKHSQLRHFTCGSQNKDKVSSSR